MFGLEATGGEAEGGEMAEVGDFGGEAGEPGVGAEGASAVGGAGGDELAEGPGLAAEVVGSPPDVGEGDEVGDVDGGVVVLVGAGVEGLFVGGELVVVGGLAELLGAEDGAC